MVNFVRKIIIFGILLFLSQDSVAKPLLWKVQGEHADIYLLGSIHFASKDTYPLADTIENSFNHCQKLAVEIDISDIERKELNEKMMDAARTGQSLFDFLDSDTYFKLDHLLSEYNINLITMDNMKPWYFILTLTGLEFAAKKYQLEEGIDRHFMKKANQKKMEIISLESIESQIEMFSGMEDSISIQLIQSILDSRTDSQETPDLLMRYWKEGKADSLKILIMNDNNFQDEAGQIFFERIYKKRNYEMVDKIIPLIHGKDNIFVVVGTAHLLGQDGIVEILKSKGYKVER